MLKAKVSINEYVCSSEEFLTVLDNNDLDRKIIDKLKSEDWYEQIKEKDLKKLVTLETSLIEDNITIDFEEKDIDFKNYSLMKKLFLISLSTVWESNITMASAFNTMKDIDRIEEKYGKCVLNFTDDEIEQTVVDLFHDLKYHKLRYQINIVTKLQDYYKKQVDSNADWSIVKDNKKLKKLLGEEVEESQLTKKDLISLAKVMPNIQDAIIPLLIFEGVAFSKIDDRDELRYLKKEDLKGNTLHVYGNGNRDGYARIIELSGEVANLVRDAINQDFIEKRAKDHSIKVVELADTPYILRPTVNGRRKINAVSDESILSFRGAYSRLTLAKEFIEATLYDVSFTPKAIETFGKVYYANQYNNDGYNVNESARMALQRFGDWYPENGARDSRNSQLVNRLKKVWSLYKK